MRISFNRILSFVLAAVLCFGIAAPAVQAAGASGETPETQTPVAPGSGLIADIAVGKYLGDEGAAEGTSFLKISHPYHPGSQMVHDPIGSAEDKEAHSKEVFADGLLDYLGKHADGSDTADLGIPYVDEGANGQGDRGQTYCWSGFAYGDWMYVGTQFNSAGATGDILGHPVDPENAQKTFGDDYFTGESDGGQPGGTLSKINVKTGEVKVIMSKAKNGLDVGFRAAVEYHGKLYFCGSVNHLPTIFEVDPTNDAFQCIYQDESMLNYPGGLGAAWKEARARKICPSIRGLTTFNDYLVISTVGMDANPYIAVSNDPSSGKFTKIASTWIPDEVPEDQKLEFPENSRTQPGELFGYAACKLQDSIVGGSIWEMVEFNNKLYVAICTGTPENAPDKTTNKEGEEVIKTMQSFALVVGEFDDSKSVDDPSAWTWRPLVGDQTRDDAPYTFGIDPERHRAAACNLVVFQDHLYIGEYNDTQISFMNMQDQEFDFLCRNLEESVSLYRLGADEKIEKVMGHSTKMFPNPIAGSDDPKYAQRDVSGFGRQENQYIWQSKVFNGKLYLGTFDETSVLKPIGKMAASQQTGINEQALADALASVDRASDASVMSADQADLFAQLADARAFYETRKQASTFREFVASTASDPFVLLPSAIFEGSQVITVDSPASLYMALLAISDLLEGNESWNLRESLAAKVQLTRQAQAVCAYMETTDDQLPAPLAQAAEMVTSQKTEIKGLQDVLKYMENAIYGFDLYVSENGVDFEHLTRSGMGDPYNQGLRVFAANNDPENLWMTIGTANPFYGTQVWRMETEGQLNSQIIDPGQFNVEVRMVTKNGKPIEREWDKADTIFVVDGTETVNPADISVIFPEAYGAISKEPVPIETDEATGVRYITVTLSGDEPVVPTHTLTFETNGGSIIEAITRDEGSQVNLNEFQPTRTGYTFAGWFTEPELTNQIETITMDTDKTVYAKWVEITYTLTFETNGGSAIDAVTAQAGTIVDLSTYVPVREGFTFAGWFSDAELTGKVDAVTLDGNKTVYAKWNEITYTLTFETNGGSTMEPVVSKTVTEVDLSLYTPTRDGFLFKGWFAEPELLTPLSTVTLDQNITVYAKWEQDIQITDHTLHFESNGGTAFSDLTVQDGTVVDLTAYVPVREGYTFAGWYTESDFTNQVSSVTVSQDMTVYAKWDEIVKYTLTFETNGGNAIAPLVRETGTVVELGSYVPTRSGYTFDGWYSDEELTLPVTQIILDQNVTVYAKWTPITYTLTFETNGGSKIESAVFHSGSVVDLSAYQPRRSGHTFAGWFTDEGLTNEIKSITMDRDKTVYAKWIENTYTLTFHTNGGSRLEPITRKNMFVVDLAEYIPVKVDHTFEGWYADEALTQPVSRVTLTEDKDVYAKWEKIPEIVTYTLTFQTNGGSKLGNIKGQPGTVVDLSSYIPVREGYRFLGWFTDPQLTVHVETITLDDDMTVYANWEKVTEAVTYTLTFQTNGGSILSSLDCPAGATVELKNYIPSRDGYHFLGWYTDPQLTVHVETITMNRDTTVYAKWEQIIENCTLTFETNGGSELGSVTGQPGTVVELKNYIPVREGYRLTGWYLDKELTQPVEQVVLNGDMTVYAGWEEIPEIPTYTLHFETNGGEPLPNILAHEGITVQLKNYTPVREGYRFEGWFLEPDFTTLVETIEMVHNTTVYAKWSLINPFTDVKDDAYYKDAVLWAVENGITNGYTPTTFAPHKECTRVQNMLFLWRYMDEPTPESRDNPFTDIKDDTYYTDAVLWAVENGITNGYTKTTFAPHEECSRANAITFLWRLAGCPAPESQEHPFTDLKDDYYTDAVLWAVENGITNGYTETTFAPHKTCTRVQIVLFLYRYNSMVEAASAD